MKLSEAIFLGSTTMQCRGGGGRGVATAGCALEMALSAVGRSDLPWTSTDSVWPWLQQPAQSNCHCIDLVAVNTYFEVVWHLFDTHVIDGAWPAMTLEQLCDWVRSVEPPEPKEFQQIIEVVAEGALVR